MFGAEQVHGGEAPVHTTHSQILGSPVRESVSLGSETDDVFLVQGVDKSLVLVHNFVRTRVLP